MANAADVTAALAAAEQAAGRDDYDAAERHLRDAAALQEAALGPAHPDLANTLNNLGVACERAGRLDDAEAAYRRAYAIAIQALPAEHPLVVRSAENLRDFCAARARPLDAPAAPVHEALPEAVQVAAPEPPPAGIEPARDPVTATTRVMAPVRVQASPADAPAPRTRFGWAVPVAIVVAIAAIVAWFVAVRPAPPPVAPPGASSSSSSDAGRPAPVAEPAPAEVRPAPAPAAPVTEAPAPAAALPPDVARADVCRNFSTATTEWRCDVVDAAATPGVLVFFTRVRAPRPTTIVHRWSHAGTLMQRVELRIAGNPREGYRTYSRQTVRPSATGEWRVELLDARGDLMYEHRFVVR